MVTPGSAKDRFDLDQLSVTVCSEMNNRARRDRRNGRREIAPIPERYAVDRGDYVARFNFSMCSGAAGFGLLKDSPIKAGHAEAVGKRSRHWTDLNADPSTRLLGRRMLRVRGKW